VSSTVVPARCAISGTVGERISDWLSSSATPLTAWYSSLARLGTCTDQVLSRKWRRSSPITVGTAKVVNTTP
jgi:hypothetical protein